MYKFACEYIFKEWINFENQTKSAKTQKFEFHQKKMLSAVKLFLKLLIFRLYRLYNWESERWTNLEKKFLCYYAAGVVGFEQPTYTFEEDAGIVNLCVTFLQPADVDPSIFVDLLRSTTDGTAVGE